MPEFLYQRASPFHFLATGTLPLNRARPERRRFFDGVLENPGWFATTESITQRAAEIAKFFRKTDEAAAQQARELRLAEDLLVKAAGVHRTAFQELQQAVSNGEEGFANGMVEMRNFATGSSS